MSTLADRHPGETAIIVGCGPSITTLRADDFPPGIVIAINQSILVVRALHLPNMVYSLQKVGCFPHHHMRDVVIPITTCICPNGLMSPPIAPEVLVLSAAESSQCFPDYPLRHVIDVTAEFHTGWSTASAECAVMLAASMGCTSLLMFGHDAYTVNSGDRFMADPYNEDADPLVGYRQSGKNAQTTADRLGLPISWR